MIGDERIEAEGMREESGRGAALRVPSATYQREQKWIAKLQ